MNNEILMRIFLILLGFFVTQEDVWGQADVDERVLSLTPSKGKQVIFNNQIELIGYDVFSDGLKLSNIDSDVIILKKGRPFTVRYYWRYIDRLARVPSFHALFINNIPIKTTHGVSQKFETGSSLWLNVEAQDKGELIGHTFFQEYTYLLPDQYLMWNPDLILRLNDSNYKGIMKLRFDDTEGAFLYGKQYLLQGNIDDALNEFLIFTERADSTHINLLGSMRALFQESSLLERSDWRVLYCLGHVARVAKLWQRSANLFREALLLNDSGADVYFYAATALSKQGLKSQALDMVQRGLEIAPQNVYLKGAQSHLTTQENYLSYSIDEWRGMTNNGYLFSYGAVWQKLRLYGGIYTLRFRVHGVPAVDIWPSMIIQIDGENVYEGEVRSREPIEIEVEQVLNTGEHLIAVWFTNNMMRTNADGQVEDSDLYVDTCEIIRLVED